MRAEQERLKTLLKEKGLKVTNQRVQILEAVSKCPGQHLTAEEIYDLVKQDFPEFGLATVYRNLQLLSELGLLEKVNLDDGFVRYELAGVRDIGNHRHHHLICDRCGMVFSFEDDLLEGLEERIMEKMGFEVLDHEVKLYGLCRQCRSRNRV